MLIPITRTGKCFRSIQISIKKFILDPFQKPKTKTASAAKISIAAAIAPKIMYIAMVSTFLFYI